MHLKVTLPTKYGCIKASKEDYEKSAFFVRKCLREEMGWRADVIIIEEQRNEI